jgi:hypothetical protein
MPLSKIDSDSLSAPLTVPAGSAAAPAITTTGDTNTGIFFPAADTIAFAEGGAEAMRINSSGNVGIGTTSPTARLTLASGTNEGAVRVGDDATYYGQLARVQATDEVRLGAYGTLQNLVFYTVSSERARILSTGQVLIDRTTNTANGKLEVYGDSDGAFNPLGVIQGAAGSTSRNSITFYRVSAGANVGTIATTNTATAYNTSSDYRLKNTIAPMTGALAKVALLKPCTYKWNVDGSDGQGFIAHELADVVPQCVSGEKDAVGEQQYEVTPAIKDEEGNTVTEAVMGTRTVPSYQGIDTSFLVATLTAAIQELKAIVDAQGAEIAALKGTP